MLKLFFSHDKVGIVYTVVLDQKPIAGVGLPVTIGNQVSAEMALIRHP